MLNLRRFLYYSVMIHTFFIFSIILYKPSIQYKKPEDALFARLVSLNDLLAQKSSNIRTPLTRHSKQIDMPLIERKRKDLSISEKDHIQQDNISTNIALPSTTQELKDVDKKGIEDKIPKKTDTKSEHLLREKLFDKEVITNLANKDTKKGKEDIISMPDKIKEKQGLIPNFAIISKQSSVFTEGLSGPVPDKSFTFDKREFKYLLYNLRLKERIESIWIYPVEAAKKGIYGDLFIKFTIKKNGRLGAVELLRTSGHQMLDDYAMKALKDGEPYWPLPEAWGMDTYTIVGHFVYTIYYTN